MQYTPQFPTAQMANDAPSGQQLEEYLSADVQRLQEAFVSIIQKLDEGQSLRRLLTRYEHKPLSLACGVAKHYYKKNAATYATNINDFYSGLQGYLNTEPDTLNNEVAFLLASIIGPSDEHRCHRQKGIRRRIKACLKRISLVSSVSKNPHEYWDFVTGLLEDYAYTNTLDLTEYDKATDKTKQVLEVFLESDSQHHQDIEKFLTANNCVPAEFWAIQKMKALEKMCRPQGSTRAMVPRWLSLALYLRCCNGSLGPASRRHCAHVWDIFPIQCTTTSNTGTTS